MSTVAVIGCGPAGLFAAKAVEDLGHSVTITSEKKRSEFYGAQYLHRPIPGFSSQAPDGEIRTIRVGSAAGYADRVYQDRTRVTSWSKAHSEPVPAWDLRKTYDAAWEHFEQQIVGFSMGVEDLEEYDRQFDLVINTAPLWRFCISSQHTFQSKTIFVAPVVMSMVSDRNYVIYNGLEKNGDNDTWYRSSQIFGHASTEFGTPLNKEAEPLRHITNWDLGFKIVGSNCDCHPNVVRAGRMGTWTPGVLTHHAYETAVSACTDRFPTTV
jgi:threonine dehydrogenase-like Zn-dependent dehydrogenase